MYNSVFFLQNSFTCWYTKVHLLIT